MKVTVKMPKVADSTDEVAVLGVLVEPGQVVASGDPVVEVETDKATVGVPTPVSGTIKELLVGVDDEIVTGTPLFEVEVTT